jgi:hypothetical protein
MKRLPTRKCLRCGHHWHPRKNGRPGVCPKCKNPRWDTKRRGNEPGPKPAAAGAKEAKE